MDKNNELFEFIKINIIRELCSKVSITEAEAIANSTILKLSHDLGGNEFYIPKSLAEQEKRKKIYNEFNGRNTSELARKYNLSERRIESIIAEERIRNQPSLF